MAGLRAASKMLMATGGADRPAVKPEGEQLMATSRRQARALESYLAIPTFIRQGRSIKL